MIFSRQNTIHIPKLDSNDEISASSSTEQAVAQHGQGTHVDEIIRY